MKLTILSAAVVAMLVSAQSAQAREHHHRFHHRHHAAFAQQDFGGSLSFESSRSVSADGYGARPSAWCGWEMRHLVGSDPGAEFNLARNWAHWGRSGPAGVGAVVVWSHHVGKIVGQENGQWIVQSGNDGHAVRTRARSIAGAIAIRWG
jgi:hypothetical protein